MRKLDAATLTAKKNPLPAGGRQDAAAVLLVCLALTLALVALASRIVSFW